MTYDHHHFQRVCAASHRNRNYAGFTLILTQIILPLLRIKASVPNSDDYNRTDFAIGHDHLWHKQVDPHFTNCKYQLPHKYRVYLLAHNPVLLLTHDLHIFQFLRIKVHDVRHFNLLRDVIPVHAQHTGHHGYQHVGNHRLLCPLRYSMKT